MSEGAKDPAALEHRIAALEADNRRLAETARRAGEIAETAPDALVVVDERGEIVYVNRRVQDLFGYSRGELVGGRLDVLLPERYRQGHERHLRHFFARPQTRAMGTGLELWARRADGSEFPVEISLSPIRLDEQTLVASSIRDASERREIEGRLQEARARAEAATEEKTRFIAAASHDLRQPLQAAAIYLDLLADGSLEPDRWMETARKARECVGSLRSLLNKVLHISKLDAGAVVANRTDFQVQSIFDRLDGQFEPLAREKGLELRIRPTRDRAHSDPILVGQILENFVSNAVRYTREGGVLIGCRRRGGRLVLQVWDTGVGIREADRKRVFRPFTRAAEAPPEAGDGMGLGLAIAGELAALLGHPIELSSRTGRGSVFELALPRARDDRREPERPGRQSGARPVHGVHLAVVDDNPAVLDALSTVLMVAGNTVTTATSTAELLAALEGRPSPPELLVTDYRLAPDETGLDAIDALRERHGAAIPAIVLTGDSSFEELERRAREGGFVVLAKPVDGGELLAEVGRRLRDA